MMETTIEQCISDYFDNETSEKFLENFQTYNVTFCEGDYGDTYAVNVSTWDTFVAIFEVVTGGKILIFYHFFHLLSQSRIKSTTI
jgi:hypothetical protein